MQSSSNKDVWTNAETDAETKDTEQESRIKAHTHSQMNACIVTKNPTRNGMAILKMVLDKLAATDSTSHQLKTNS